MEFVDLQHGQDGHATARKIAWGSLAPPTCQHSIKGRPPGRPRTG